MAVELSGEGWSVPLISRQLGHSSIATTQTYLDHLHPAEVIDRLGLADGIFRQEPT